MKTVSIHEAETNLARLIEEAARGDALVIADDAGKPLVKLVAVEAPAEEPDGGADQPKKRRIGFLKGKISVPDDFDTMFAKEIEEMFYGEEK
jgi:antitoxin (DNA-binding transcriptional repressor) of toxin-antitoxin stability system